MYAVFKIFLALNLLKSNLIATENLKNSCDNLSVDYEENEFLTRREQLDLMDSALLKSIENFDECISNKSKKNNGNLSEVIDDNDARESNELRGASNDNYQDNIDDLEQNLSDVEEIKKPVSISQESKNNDSLLMQNKTLEISGNNGKIPDDIPLDDNDDVLAKQIKNAALNEADPEKQKKLWDEYRRYKNLKIN